MADKGVLADRSVDARFGRVMENVDLFTRENRERSESQKTVQPRVRESARTHVIVLCQTRHCDQGASAVSRVPFCFFSFGIAVGIRATFALAIDDNALRRSEREYAHAAKVHRVDVECPCRFAETWRRVRRGRDCRRSSDVDGSAGVCLCSYAAHGETIQVDDIVTTLSVSIERG